MKRFVAALCCAVLATAAVAQEKEPGQPPGGGGRGRGGAGGFGRGGGFGMMGGISSSYVQMLEMKEVQEDLKLSADEKGNIPVLKDELTEGDKKFGEGLQGVDRTQMREKFNERRLEIEKQIKEVLGDKYTRFHQIKLQLDGMYAAVSRDKDVQSALNITEDQKTQLQEAMRPPEGQGGRNAFRFNPGDPPPSEEKMKEMREQGAKMMEEMQKRQAEALDKVLTADQKKKWEELIGTKITYKRPTPQFGGPGGIRFGGGGPGGAGGGGQPGQAGGGGRRRRGGGGGNPPPSDDAKKPPMMVRA